MAKKRILAAILLAVITVGGTGCMFTKTTSFRTLAISNMEQKYGESFTFVSDWGASYASGNIQEILVKSDSMDGEILVQGVRNGKDYTFRDNYLAVKYCAEMEAAVKAVSDEVFGSSTVIYSVMPQALSPELGKDATFEAYSTDPGSGITVSVAVAADAFDEAKLDVYTRKFQETGITASVQLLVLNAGDCAGLNAAAFNNLIDARAYHYCAIIQISAERIKIYPGEDGLYG